MLGAGPFRPTQPCGSGMDSGDSRCERRLRWQGVPSSVPQHFEVPPNCAANATKKNSSPSTRTAPTSAGFLSTRPPAQQGRPGRPTGHGSLPSGVALRFSPSTARPTVSWVNAEPSPHGNHSNARRSRATLRPCFPSRCSPAPAQSQATQVSSSHRRCSGTAQSSTPLSASTGSRESSPSDSQVPIGRVRAAGSKSRTRPTGGTTRKSSRSDGRLSGESPPRCGSRRELAAVPSRAAP